MASLPAGWARGNLICAEMILRGEALSGWLLIFLAPFLFAVVPHTGVIDYPPERTPEAVESFKLGL